MKNLLLIITTILVAFSSIQCSNRPNVDYVTIRFLGAPDTGGGWNEIMRQFELANPDIHIELVEGPTATDTRENMYSAAFIAGEAVYDLVYMDIVWVSKFAATGWITPLDDLFTPAKQKEFLPGDVAGSKYKGKIYRVPMRTDVGVLYYRKDLLEAVGRQPPSTWNELTELAQQIQRPPELWGFVFQGRQYEGLVCNFLELVWGAGGDFIDDEGNVLIDQPEAISALEWLCNATRSICPPGVATYQEEESRNIFQEGRAIFMRNWPYAWTLAQQEHSPIRGKVGIIPMVHKSGLKENSEDLLLTSAATLGGWGFGISSFSAHKKEAGRFIEFATSARGQKGLHFSKGAIPTRHALFHNDEILKESPHYSELYKILLLAKPRPVHPRYSQISDILQYHVSRALIGTEEPAEALKKTAQEIKDILQK